MSKQKPANLAKKQTSSAVQQIYGQLGIENASPKVETKWEELDAIFEESAKAIVVSAKSVDDALKVPGVIENMPNLAETQLAVNGFKNDLNVFTDKLLAIRSRHEGKTGPIQSQDDLATSIDIGEDYAEFALQFQAVTMPTVLTIMDHIGGAVINSKQRAQANAPAEVEVTEEKKDVE